MIFFDAQVLGVDANDLDVDARLWRSFFDLWISMIEADCNLWFFILWDKMLQDFLQDDL